MKFPTVGKSCAKEAIHKRKNSQRQHIVSEDRESTKEVYRSNDEKRKTHEVNIDLSSRSSVEETELRHRINTCNQLSVRRSHMEKRQKGRKNQHLAVGRHRQEIIKNSCGKRIQDDTTRRIRRQHK